MTRTRPRFLASFAVVAAATALVTCGRDTVAPRQPAALAVGATLPVGLDLAAFNLSIDQARLIAVTSAGDTAFDKIFPFPATQSQLSVSADVPLAQSPETFLLTIQLLSGTTLLFSGTQTVTLASGSNNATAQIPVTYSGPGQNVASLVLGPLDSLLTEGATLQMRVIAKDAVGATVPSFYVSWSTSDTVAAPIDATGILKAPLLRKTVTVKATTPTAVTASTTLQFIPALASVQFDSGCAQSALPGVQLPQPIVARVLGTDNLGVPGVPVTFSAITTGGLVATPTATTDTGGRARTLVTLPGTAGPAQYQASVTGLSAAVCAPTVLSSPPTQLAFKTQPATAVAGTAIGSFQVEIRDANGTLVTGATNAVTIAILNNAGGGTLSGTKTVNAVGGVATFTGLSVDKVGVGYTLQATASGLTSASSSAFNITPAALNSLVFTAQPVNLVAGATMPAVVVTARDAFANTVTTFTGNVALAFGSHPSGSTIGGTDTVAAVAGVATFSALGRFTVAGGYTLVASASGVGSTASNTFTVSPAPAAALAFFVQPTSGLAGTIITPPVVVQIEDSLGNVVTTATNAVTISFAANPGQSILGGTPTKNAASGLAQFTDLTVSTAASGYKLLASATGLTSVTSVSFDMLVRPPGVVWTNLQGGNWSNPLNWSPARVPGPSDTASIVLPGAYVVTLDVNAHVAFLAVGDTIGGIVLDMSPAVHLFIDSSAVILRAGSVVLAGSDTIGGPGNLTNQGSLAMTGSAITTAGFSNVFVLQAQGTNTITGLFSNSAGGALFVEGGAASGDGILTFSSGFLNAGSIVLSNGDAAAAHNAVINVTSGSLTNLGLIQSASVAVGNPPGGRTLHTPLDNQGSVIVQETLTLDQAGAGHSNSGVISLQSGNLDVILSGVRPGFANLPGGTIDVGLDTLQIINQSTGSFLNDSAATLLGAGVIDIGTSSFITNGIVTVGETGPAILAFTGPYIQGPPSVLNVFLTSPVTPGVTYSQFQVSDNVTIQAGATLTGAGTYTSGSYVIMTVPAGKSITGDFTTKNLPINPLNGGTCTGSVVGTQYVVNCP